MVNNATADGHSRRVEPSLAGVGRDDELLTFRVQLAKVEVQTVHSQIRHPRLFLSCAALIMFARTAIRAATKPVAFRTVRTAVTIAPSVSEVHAMNPHGLDISKAQGVAKNGLVSGRSIQDSANTHVEAETDI